MLIIVKPRKASRRQKRPADEVVVFVSSFLLATGLIALNADNWDVNINDSFIIYVFMAKVYGNARIYDGAEIEKDAEICENATVCHDASVFGKVIKGDEYVVE